MKIKATTYLIIISIALFVSSMSLMNTKNMQDISQEGTAYSDEIDQAQNRPLYHKGVLTFKLKEGLGDFQRMESTIRFGIPPLDRICEKYEVSLLKKCFTYRKDMLRDDLPDLSRIYQIRFPEKYPVSMIVRELNALDEIEYAEADPVIYKCEVPNDPLYNNQYHLPKIAAAAAWDIHKGENGPEILIGIADDAVDWRHEDLIDNQWENLGEDFDGDGHVIEFDGTNWIFDPDDENGVDDDGNGMIDDFVGWDFYNQDGEEDNDPTPELAAIDHGTHCIGIANSRTNNSTDCASIAWNVKFVSAKLANQGGGTFDASAYDGIIYLAELGADILTCSWIGSKTQSRWELIQYIQGLGCIIVAGAGNESDEEFWYPAAYPGVISVAATNNWDVKADFSSYGISVDVSAPGVNIMSLKPFNNTQTMSGTSMSTPLTAGYIALLKSYYTSWSNEEIIEQALATCDDIDTNNSASLANKLGYGRINAFRGLTETGTSTPEELKLHFVGSKFSDADTNGFVAPGEEVSLSFEMMNFAVGLDTTDVTFNLSTASPYINMINDEIIYDVPSDNYFTLDSAFLFQLDPGIDSTRIITFTITASSSVSIPLEDEWEIELIVNQMGVLVFNGQGSGSAYSGPYIRDFLHNEGIPVFYTDVLPPGFIGFDVVFLSFGNFGSTLSNGTAFSIETVDLISDYLYQGGYLYEDCGSFFGLMDYYSYDNQSEIQMLCGIDTVITPLTYNSIDVLNGLENSIGEDLTFVHSTQSPNYYIDIMEPDSTGIAMFEEDDYGIVAVQAEGEYGQRTVCFSYSIAHLQDDSLSTNELLLARIAEYFDLLNVDINEPSDIQKDVSVEIYPNPAQDYCNIKLHVEEFSEASLRIFDISGKIVQGQDNLRLEPGNDEIMINTSSLSSGIYFIQLKSDSFSVCKKLVKR